MNVLKMTRKALTTTVVTATIAWSVGAMSLVAPLAASAATASGDLVKGSLSAVYYIGADGKRYVFPTEKTYKSWYPDFSAVKTISDAELSSIAFGSTNGTNVTYKPGAKMVKIVSDPKVYAVDANGSLRWITSEALATALYGANWNKMIDDLPDSFYTNYKLGADITVASQFAPATATAAATSINADKMLTAAAPAGAMFTVTLASDSPAAATIVAGQALATLAHLNFAGTGTVSTVRLQRLGVSNSTTLTSVYLFNGATRLTDSASVSNDGSISFNGGTAGLFTVAGSAKITVRADVATGTNGQTIGVGMTSYTSAGGTATPVSGVSASIFSIAASTGMTAVNVGLQTVAAASVNAGSMAYTAWSAPVTVSGRIGSLANVTLKFIGSAPYDTLANAKLYLDGVAQGTGTTVNSLGYLVFDSSTAPISMSTGAHTVDVRADIVKGSNRNFYLSLQNAGDFLVNDSQLAVGVAASSPTAGSFGINSGGLITVNAGSVTVTLDPAFNAATTVTGGGSNATIGKFKVQTYGEDVKVTSVSVLPVLTSPSPAAAGLNNVSLYYNGAQVGSSTNWTTAALIFQLGSSMITTAGTTGTFEVRADLQTSTNISYTAGTVGLTLNAGTTNAQGQTSSNSTGFPTAAVSTNGLTMTTGVLSLARNPAYLNTTVNPNTSGVRLASFVLQNTSSSEAVRVTNLAASIAFGGAQASTNLSNLRTTETSGSGATPISPATGTPSANNFSTNFTMAPGDTKTIDLLVDLSTTTSGTLIATLTPTALGVTSNVTLVVTATAGQTITVSTGSMSAGSLQSSGSLVAQYILGGAQNLNLATFNFVANNGAATISELKFTVSGTGTSPIATVKLGNASAAVVGGIAYFTGLNLTVPNSPSGLNVLVSPSMSAVGNNAEAGNATAALTLSYLKYTIGGVTTTLNPNTSGTILTTYTSGAVTALGNVAITFASTTPMRVGMTVQIAGATAAVGTVASITSGTVAVINLTTVGATPAGNVTALASSSTITTFSGGAYAAGAGTAVTVASTTGLSVGTIIQLLGTTGVAGMGIVTAIPNATTATVNMLIAQTTATTGNVAFVLGPSSNSMTLVGSKPTVTVAATPNSLTAGTIATADITVTASASGDVGLTSLPVAFALSGGNGAASLAVALNAVTLTETNGSALSIVPTAGAGSSGTCTLASGTGGAWNCAFTFATAYTISAGTSKTFRVFVPLTGTLGTSATLSTAVDSVTAGKALLLWNDVTGGTTANTGALLFDYPTATAVIKN